MASSLNSMRMCLHLHARLLDAIQAGRAEDAYQYARLLAWFARLTHREELTP